MEAERQRQAQPAGMPVQCQLERERRLSWQLVEAKRQWHDWRSMHQRAKERIKQWQLRFPTPQLPRLEALFRSHVRAESNCLHRKRSTRTGSTAGGLAIEDFFPVRAEGFDEDVFDRLVVLVAGIEFAAALSLAQMDPVGGAVAGAGKARGFAEGLQQDGADSVALAPVVGELSLEAGEQMGSQGRETDPGQDEIAGVIDDQGQVALAGGGLPADETVAGGRFFQAAAPKPSRASRRPSAAWTK